MMIRAIVLLALCPAVLAAQDTYVGVRAGPNITQIRDGLTRSGPAVGVFAQTSVSRHVGLEWGVDWMRSAVEQFDMSSVAPPPIGEPEYVTTDLVARISASHPFFDGGITFGVAASAGGWLGVRSGGHLLATDPRHFDFGHVWGVSLCAIRGRVKLEGSLEAYHGEREIWEWGPRQRGSRAFVGLAYRIR